MSEIAALDALGRDLGIALRRELPRLRRRRRTWLAAGLLTLTIAVPAAGTVTDWAGLAGGETALPTQVPNDLRLALASGRDERGPWRLDVYRARLATLDGQVGICVFLSRRDGGTGRCAPARRLASLVDIGEDLGLGLAGGVVHSGVARVEVTLERYGGRPSRVVAVTPSPAPAAQLRDRGLPDDLEPFVVALTRDESRARGLRALDAEGRTIAVSGSPAPAAPMVPARPSPVPAPEVGP